MIRSDAQQAQRVKSLEERLVKAEAELCALMPDPGRGRRQHHSEQSLQDSNALNDHAYPHTSHQPAQSGFIIIAYQSFRVFRFPRILIQPDLNASVFGYADDLIIMDVIARKLTVFVEHVAGNELFYLIETDDQPLTPPGNSFQFSVFSFQHLRASWSTRSQIAPPHSLGNTM